MVEEIKDPVPAEPAPEPAPEVVPESNKIGFLDEQVGQKSAMRLMCLISLIAGVILFFISAIGGLAGNDGTAQATQAAITLISVAFTGKITQKFNEKV